MPSDQYDEVQIQVPRRILIRLRQVQIVTPRCIAAQHLGPLLPGKSLERLVRGGQRPAPASNGSLGAAVGKPRGAVGGARYQVGRDLEGPHESALCTPAQA